MTPSSSRSDAPDLTQLLRNPQVTLAWVGFFACFFTWFGFAPVAVRAVAELGFGERVAVTVGIVNVFGAVPARVVVGRLADRIGTHRTFQYLFLISALVVVLTATATTLPQLIVARALAGFSGSAFVVATKHAADWVPRPMVGFAQGLVTGFGNLGIATAAIALVQFGSWRLAVATALGPLLVAFGLWTRFAADRGRSGRSQTSVAAKPKLMHPLAVTYAVSYGLQLAVATAAAPWLVSKGLGREGAAVSMALFVGLNVVFRPWGGRVVDSSTDPKRALARLLVVQATLTAIAVGAAASGSLPVLVGAFVLAGAAVIAVGGGVYSVVPAVRPSATGSVSGVVASVGIVGAALWLTLDVQSGFAAVLVTTAVGAAGCALWLYAVSTNEAETA